MGGTGAVGITLVGTATNDTKMTLLVLLAFWCVTKYLIAMKEGIEAKRFIVYGGLLAGVVTAFKLPALCYAVGLFAGFVFSARWTWRHVFLCMIFGLSMLAGFLLADGLWMLHIYKRFASPLFPYFNNFFHSPWTSFESYKDPRFFPHGSILFSPFFAAAWGEAKPHVFKDMRLPVIYLMSIAAFAVFLFVKKKTEKTENNLISWHIALFLSVFLLVSYIMWLYTATIYRFMLPFEMLSGLGIIVLLDYLVVRKNIRYALFVLLTALFFCTTRCPDFGRLPFGKSWFLADHIPQIQKNAWVILTSEPFGYMIPLFQPDVHFLGNFGVFPDHLPGVSRLLSDPKQSFYVLGFPGVGQRILSPLKEKYHLVMIDKKCEIIKTNVGVGETITLCPLRHLTKQEKN